jgi:hypothetical protein
MVSAAPTPPLRAFETRSRSIGATMCLVSHTNGEALSLLLGLLQLIRINSLSLSLSLLMAVQTFKFHLLVTVVVNADCHHISGSYHQNMELCLRWFTPREEIDREGCLTPGLEASG